MLTNSMRHFPKSMLYHYSSINLQKIHLGIFLNSHIQNMMLSENKALISNFPKTKFKV